MPKAMQRKLDALRAACEALPKQQPAAPVVCPIFGNAPPPVPAPLPANLPPLLAQASARLAEALVAPAKPLEGWPFVNPPRVDAYIKQQAVKPSMGGRPIEVQPHQAVRVARFVRLGYTSSEAAAKAGLSRTTAQRVLAGIHPITKHPAVVAAGVEFPVRKEFERPKQHAQNCAKPPSCSFYSQDGGQDERTEKTAQNAANSKGGQA
jgi:hypothetical protein